MGNRFRKAAGAIFLSPYFCTRLFCTRCTRGKTSSLPAYFVTRHCEDICLFLYMRMSLFDYLGVVAHLCLFLYMKMYLFNPPPLPNEDMLI